MKFRQRLFGSVKVILTLILIFPMAAYAHLISITPTIPFPASVVATSSATATFTVTNITSRTNVTVIDQSNFASGSGFSIASSTCGTLLTPGQSCAIQVTLQAASTAQTMTGMLKEWAQPSADGVQYPLSVNVIAGSTVLPNISLVPVNSAGLPAVRDPITAQHAGNWLLVSGSTGSFHDFNRDFITGLYVFNPSTTQSTFMSYSSTNLPLVVKQQLTSTNPQYLEDGDTLYIIGGFYTPDNVNWTTLNTITAINIPGMINAILNNNTNLAPFVTYNTSIPQFKVTGGQLGKIGNYFYLTFGQDCEGGDYCAPPPPSSSQTYTDSIYQFTADPTLASVTIVNTVTHADLDGSGWRRRDYTLMPFMLGTTQTLFAQGGPFTPGDNALVWTNGIYFGANLQPASMNNNFINQQANQYLSPNLSMYSVSNNQSYAATFSGLSNLYWATNGLNYNNSTLYGNILDLISYDSSGNVQEYANLQPLCSGQPLASCLYMGLAGEFIPNGSFYDSRHILQLDQLPQNTPTLVGYVYGGLVSTQQAIFTNPPSPSVASNQVYAVYVTPAGSSTNWQNITNLFPGN